MDVPVASEEQFRSLVESTSDWIWQVDRHGVYTYASPRVKSLLGYEPEEIVGKSPFDLMSPEEAARVADEFNECVANARPIVALANVNIHKNGGTVVLETSGMPILDEQGQLVGYRGVDRDITERKQAEMELRRLRTLLANVVDSMPSVLIGLDREGKIICSTRLLKSPRIMGGR